MVYGANDGYQLHKRNYKFITSDLDNWAKDWTFFLNAKHIICLGICPAV